MGFFFRVFAHLFGVASFGFRVSSFVFGLSGCGAPRVSVAQGARPGSRVSNFRFRVSGFGFLWGCFYRGSFFFRVSGLWGCFFRVTLRRRRSGRGFSSASAYTLLVYNILFTRTHTLEGFRFSGCGFLLSEVGAWRQTLSLRRSGRAPSSASAHSPRARCSGPCFEENDNLLVRIHFIIEMIRWTGLAPWEPLAAPRPPRAAPVLPDPAFERQLKKRRKKSQLKKRRTVNPPDPAGIVYNKSTCLHAIKFRASCDANLITPPPLFGRDETARHACCSGPCFEPSHQTASEQRGKILRTST